MAGHTKLWCSNGGTIRTPQSSLSDSNPKQSYANVVIEFDFGTPGDNKMSWLC